MQSSGWKFSWSFRGQIHPMMHSRTRNKQSEHLLQYHVILFSYGEPYTTPGTSCTLHLGLSSLSWLQVARSKVDVQLMPLFWRLPNNNLTQNVHEATKQVVTAELEVQLNLLDWASWISTRVGPKSSSKQFGNWGRNKDNTQNNSNVVTLHGVCKGQSMKGEVRDML